MRRSSNVARGGAVGLLAWLGAGCLYLHDVNQRPAIEIVRRTTTAIERGAPVELEAQVQDPDSNEVTLQWRAYACGATTALCDDVPFAEATLETFRPTVPSRTAGAEPVQHVRITLDASDEHGARAQLPQVLELDVVNATPSVMLQKVGTAAVLGHPVELRALRQDADDPATSVTLTWQLFGPAGSARPALRPVPSGDPAVEAQEFTPDVVGAWTLMVTARDPAGAVGTGQLAFVISPDRPPCLVALAPSAAAPLVLDQLRRFAVVVVDDDLDPFPAEGSGARFAWSLLAPSRGAGRAALGGPSDHAVELDPATFVPGELLELRVEVSDQVARTLPCADGDASCSIGSDGCDQRRTWRMEVR